MAGRQQAAMTAQVNVDSLPEQRDVVALERQADGLWRVCGSARSDAYGVALINIEAQPDSQIVAVSVDDWGDVWSAGKSVTAGIVIRPTQFAGLVYRVIQAGQLPQSEPTWSTTPGGSQAVGTAVLQCKRYYRPLAHGPVPLEFTSIDPHWANVTSLVHFDGTVGSAAIQDDAQLTWTASGGVTLTDAAPAIGSTKAEFNVGLISSNALSLLALAGDEWTLEFRMSPVSSANTPHLLTIGSAENNRLTLFLSGGYLRVFTKVGNDYGERIVTTINPPPSTLSHIALERRSDGLITLYFDGFPAGTTNTTVLPSGSCSACFGHQPWNGLAADRYRGFLDELRITKGLARYQGAFVPSSSPFPGGG